MQNYLQSRPQASDTATNATLPLWFQGTAQPSCSSNTVWPSGPLLNPPPLSIRQLGPSSNWPAHFPFGLFCWTLAFTYSHRPTTCLSGPHQLLTSPPVFNSPPSGPPLASSTCSANQQSLMSPGSTSAWSQLDLSLV